MPNTGGCQLTWLRRPFPWQTAVLNPLPSQAQLGVGGDDEPGPAIGLLRMPHPRWRPTETLLAATQRVVQVEAPDLGAPEQIQIWHPRSSPPQPQELRRIQPGRQALDLDQHDGPTHDGT